MIEDKVSLAAKRAELVEISLQPLPPEERIRIQGELSIVNAKIKALNTTSAAQLKAAADRRKAAGMAEAQANAVRARANLNGSGTIVGPIDDEAEDDDPGQTAAIDGWIDAVLLRHDVDFVRGATGTLKLTSTPSRPHIPQKLAATIELLAAGLYAAARGQELPDLPSEAPKATFDDWYAAGPKAAKAWLPKAAKAKPKKR
jgi:hypothetical protein